MKYKTSKTCCCRRVRIRTIIWEVSNKITDFWDVEAGISKRNKILTRNKMNMTKKMMNLVHFPFGLNQWMRILMDAAYIDLK